MVARAQETPVGTPKVSRVTEEVKFPDVGFHVNPLPRLSITMHKVAEAQETSMRLSVVELFNETQLPDAFVAIKPFEPVTTQ